jgi:peptidoglycan/xylan/chitin deacetylase (PgdA/CDA1 family)
MLAVMPSSELKRRLRSPAARILLAGARLRPAAGAAVCYHRVGDPQGRAGVALVPALGTRLFAAQLDMLRRRFRLVTASELPEAVAIRRRGERPPLAVTFDDDLGSHTAVTLELLGGVPATFFLGGGSLDGPRPFFWEALQQALDAGLPADDPQLPRVPDPHGPGGAHRLAGAIRTWPREQRDALTAALLERAGGEPEPGLREREVRRLVEAGCEIGFHTRDHESLEQLGDAALAAALRDGRERLEAIAGRPLRALAYPFGIADDRVAAAARAAGFATGYTLAPAAVRDGDDPLRLGRLQPSFTSVAHLELDLARAITAVRGRDRRGPGG